MKKLLLIILVCVILFPQNVVYADGFNAVVDSKTADNGDTVEINISFENNNGIIAALFDVEYDKERLELVDVQDGFLLEGGTFSPDYSAYPYKMVWNSASTENFCENGILATLIFKVRENAESGKAYINLYYNEDDVFDVELNNVFVNVVNGGIEIPEKSSYEKNHVSGSGATGSAGSKPIIEKKAEVKDDNTEPTEPATPENKIIFTDVKENDWFCENVKYVAENGLMNGTTNTEFAPNDNLTRAMLVAILYRAAGEPETNKSVPFADVTADSYYANAVIWAQQNGIVSGVNENEFAPDENITREQIATIIYRYANYKGYDTSAKADILAYADCDEISEYATEAMQYAVANGLIKGKTEATLNPQDNATRAEIAAILQRFIEANK